MTDKQREGRLAFWAMVAISDCPYPIGSGAWIDWCNGWEQEYHWCYGY